MYWIRACLKGVRTVIQKFKVLVYFKMMYIPREIYKKI